MKKDGKNQNAEFKAYFHRGNCYRQIKEYNKSIEDLQKACEIKKDNAPAQNNLGLSYFENQLYDQVLWFFYKIIFNSFFPMIGSDEVLKCNWLRWHKSNLLQQ